MPATTFEAGDERGGLLARAGGVTNVVAAAALAEDGGVTGNVDAAMSAKHADAVAAEEGREGAVAVKDDDRDGCEGESLEAFGAEEPAGEEAEFRLSEAGVAANFREEGLLLVNVAVGVAGGHAAELHMDPFLARDDVAFAKDVGEVLLVGEGVSQGDFASDGEREVAGRHRGAIFDRAARPCALDETKGRACDRPLDGSADPHDETRGRAAVHLKEGSRAVLPSKGSFPIGVGEAAIASDDEASRFNDRGTGWRGRGWLGGGTGSTGGAVGSRASSLGEGDGRGRGPTRARGTGGEGGESTRVSSGRGSSQRGRVSLRATHLRRRGRTVRACNRRQTPRRGTL